MKQFAPFFYLCKKTKDNKINGKMKVKKIRLFLGGCALEYRHIKTQIQWDLRIVNIFRLRGNICSNQCPVFECKAAYKMVGC